MDREAVAPIKVSFPVKKDDFQLAGEASSKIKKVLLQLGFPGEIIRKITISAYEAEMNIVIHSWGGSLDFEILPEQVVVAASDKGPGIPDLDLAMREGYSTAPDRIRSMGFGAGMGLPNMRNCSDDFQIESNSEHGTKIRMVIYGKKE